MSYALVTGAAKGIGKALARELAQKNYHLLLVDIDEEGLIATAGEIKTRWNVSVDILPLDLSAHGAIERLHDWTSDHHDHLKIVINNAGYGLNGPFAEMGLEEQLNIIDVNIKAQVSISHTYIPVLRRQEEAWLLNVASTTAYQSIPYFAVYAASKAFVLSFTRSLRYELSDTRISVSALSPGSTDTNFVHRARMSESLQQKADRYNMQPQAVARIALKGLFAGKAEILPGFVNQLHAFLPRFFRKDFIEKIGGRIYGPRPEKRRVRLDELLPLAD